MALRTLTSLELDEFKSQASWMAQAAADTESIDLPFIHRLAETPAAIAEWATERTCMQGEVVFEEGDSGDALYIILSGKTIVVGDRFGTPRFIALRGPGEVIGEMALVENRPRMATVAALEPTRLLRISRESFNGLLGSSPEFGLELLRILSGRLRLEAHRPPPAQHDAAITDQLTGVYARAAFDARLHELAAQTRRYGGVFALLAVDLDHFKSINDGFGHSRGDEVLKEFARRAGVVIRECDLVFRYGGDEFCLLLPDTSSAQAVALARRLLDTVRGTPFAGAPPLTLTLSIGVAAFPEDLLANQAAPQFLLEIADRRMYEAKRGGRALVVGPQELAPAPAQPGARTFPLAPAVSRLIERDSALEGAQRFFEQLPQARCAGLWIRGQRGCGSSRFLHEVAAYARLRNYAVLTLSGAEETKDQALGAVAAARLALPGEGSWPLPEEPGRFAETLAAVLPAYLSSGRKDGLVMALDNVDLLDEACLLGFRRLSEMGLSIPIGIAYAKAERSLLGPGTLQSEIALEPFSAQGVRVWLRYSLHWEAPERFVERLRRISGGRPAPLQREVARMIESGALALKSEGWVLDPSVAG